MSPSAKSTSYIALKIDHVLVALGFLLGFGFVFSIAIVYHKVKPLERFQFFNNNTQVTGKTKFLKACFLRKLAR